MVFDLVFSPNQHAFTGANHFDHWMIVLESLKALQGYDTIIIGHDTPADRPAIDSTMTYIKRAKEIHAASVDAKTYSENLKAAFPDLQQTGFVDLSASYLYTAPHGVARASDAWATWGKITRSFERARQSAR